MTWSSVFIPAKLVGLLAIHEVSLAWGDGDETIANGSAKVVLLAIERAHGAWLALVDGQHLAMSAATPFIADLVWLHESLDAAIPQSRDEPSTGPDALAQIGHMA